MAGPRLRRRTLVAAGATAAVVATGSLLWMGARPDERVVQAAAPTPAAAPPQQRMQCTVGYAIRSAVGGRISTAVTIANTGTGAAQDWHLTFVLPDGQKLVRGWDRGWAQDGQALRVRGTGLAAGDRVRTGFDASYRDATTLPGQFRLNGTVCSAEMSVAGATSPATPATERRATVARATTAKKSDSGEKSGGSSGSGSGGKNDKEKSNKGKAKGKGKNK